MATSYRYLLLRQASYQYSSKELTSRHPPHHSPPKRLRSDIIGNLNKNNQTNIQFITSSIHIQDQSPTAQTRTENWKAKFLDWKSLD